jgi:hypothetical protein
LGSLVLSVVVEVAGVLIVPVFTGARKLPDLLRLRIFLAVPLVVAWGLVGVSVGVGITIGRSGLTGLISGHIFVVVVNVCGATVYVVSCITVDVSGIASVTSGVTADASRVTFGVTVNASRVIFGHFGVTVDVPGVVIGVTVDAL